MVRAELSHLRRLQITLLVILTLQMSLLRHQIQTSFMTRGNNIKTISYMLLLHPKEYQATKFDCRVHKNPKYLETLTLNCSKSHGYCTNNDKLVQIKHLISSDLTCSHTKSLVT